VIGPLRVGGRLLDVATLGIAVPLSAASYAQASGRPWEPAVHVTVLAIALLLALWSVRSTPGRVSAASEGARLRLRIAWTAALIAVALLDVRGLEAAPAAAWALTFGFALALLSVARAGWRVLSFGRQPSAPAGARGRGRPALPALDEAPRRPGPEQAFRPGRDEVTYAAGRPNVLTITKFAQAEPSRGEAFGVCQRADRAGDAVLALAGALDVVTVSEFQPLVEAVVAERCRSIVLDAGALRRIDSTGVSAIVGLVKRSRAFGGVVRVSGLKDQPLEVFRLLRMDLIFELPDGSPRHAAS
jgi:anti-anti-sigma factor